jgi:hypothetical protein
MYAHEVPNEDGLMPQQVHAPQSAEAGAAEGRIEHVTYDGARPDCAELRQSLELGSDYLYLVATAEQERLRQSSAAARQRSRDESAHVEFVLKFEQVVRQEMGIPVLTRTEDRICLRRAITRCIAGGQVETMVRHDVFTWLDALHRLEQEGHDLTSGIPAELAGELVSAQVGRVLVELHTALVQERAATNLPSFEEAFRGWLAGFSPPPVIVMDGFTYLFPLQRRFVDHCVARGARVVFVYPYRDEQERGFAIMRRTYEAYSSTLEARRFSTLPEKARTDLESLQRWLFAAEAPQRSESPDGSVELAVHPHRHQEIASCVERIIRYLGEGSATEELAIVTRNPAEFQSLLQEEARRKGLDAVFSIEPRQLLLTPLGRFILTLYEVHQDQALKITPDQFETMLASGWLGSMRQSTVDERCSPRYRTTLPAAVRGFHRSVLDPEAC